MNMPAITPLNGMVESQMEKAATAQFWYTAWVNAGKPDLSKWMHKCYKTK
jgi:hypothetical protein